MLSQPNQLQQQAADSRNVRMQQLLVRLLYRAPTPKQALDKPVESSSSSSKSSSKKSRSSSASPSLITAASPSPSPSSSPSPMEDAAAAAAAPAESPFPLHCLLSLSVDPAWTGDMLKTEILSSPACSPTALLTLLYQGELLSASRPLSSQLQLAGGGAETVVTAVAVEPPPESAVASSPSAALSSSGSSSSLHSSSAASASSPHPSSSSFLSSSSSSSRRPPAEQVLSDLNRLITPEILAPLLEMGFSEGRAIKALILNMLNPEIAITWLLEHAEDADIDDPLTPQQLYVIARAFHLIPSQEMEDCVRAAVCTFSITQRVYAPQQYFLCHTCGLTGGRGCCVSCARVCHANHEVEGPIASESFFCDCGAGDGGVVCRALRRSGEAGAGGGSGTRGGSDAVSMDDSKGSHQTTEAEAEEERKLKERAVAAAAAAAVPARQHRRQNHRIAINDLAPYDFISSLSYFQLFPPLPPPQSVAVDSSALSAWSALHAVLVQGDDKAVRSWLAQHERTLTVLHGMLDVALAGSSSPSDIAALVLSPLAWVTALLPMPDEAAQTRLLGLLQQTLKAANSGAVPTAAVLQVMVNVFSSPYALQLLHPLLSHSVALCSLPGFYARSPSPVPTAPRLIQAQLLFNVCLLLHSSSSAQAAAAMPDPSSLVSVMVSLLSSQRDEQTLRLLVIGLTLLCVDSGAEMKLLCLRLGVLAAIEPVVARKPEPASAFAQLLLRLLRE